MDKVEVSICVGSSCHLKGSRDVIEQARNEISRLHLQDKVELKAAFCFGQCGHDGVTVKVNDKIIPGLTPEKIASLFEEEILPLTK